MCGIVGYVGRREALQVLLPALKRLEYRGYDSAGVAVLNGVGVQLGKSAGRIELLERELEGLHLQGVLGIAHTRWATHGAPSRDNAHPHCDCSSGVALVHNGIVENHRRLRAELVARGHRFRSETDTEVIAHLIEEHLDLGLRGAIRAAAAHLEGAWALACITEREPGTLIAIRRGSPLVIGRGDGELLVASDVPALLGLAEEYTVLDDDEMAVLHADGVRIEKADGTPVTRVLTRLDLDQEAAEKAGYPHFMLKEIHEQPEAIRATLRDHVEPSGDRVTLPELRVDDDAAVALSRVTLVACGTSWHAGMVVRGLVERLCRIPAEAEIASEFRYRDPLVGRDVLAVPISQSGETADTLAALRLARSRGAHAAAVCNVVGSSLARESDSTIFTRAGLEIGVASTKAFTAQIVAGLLLAVRLGQQRGTVGPDDARRLLAGLAALPDRVAEVLEGARHVEEAAQRFADRPAFLFLGRGAQYAVALEGALKLKEISYVHAEGHPAGEIKHGPIALVEEGVPIVVLSPRGPTYDKTASNIEEVRARGGTVLAVGTAGDSELEESAEVFFPVPEVEPELLPILTVVPLQLLAYHVGVLRGCDVDKPRNLAKSVTVE